MAGGSGLRHGRLPDFLRGMPRIPRAAPQTVQTASPVCGTKNFSSVRLYSAAIHRHPRTVRLGPSICQTVKLTHYPLIPYENPAQEGVSYPELLQQTAPAPAPT